MPPPALVEQFGDQVALLDVERNNTQGIIRAGPYMFGDRVDHALRLAIRDIFTWWPVNYLLKEKAGSTMLELKTFLDSSRLGAALLAGRINS